MGEENLSQPSDKVKTFAEWENICECSEADSKEEAEAINKMVELATNEEEWELVKFWAGKGAYPEIEVQAVKKLKVLRTQK